MVEAGAMPDLIGLTPPEPFRWFPYLGARHAVWRANALPGAKNETLCGVEVIMPNADPPKYPDWLWPECVTCDHGWRKQTGLPQRGERAQALGSTGRDTR